MRYYFSSKSQSIKGRSEVVLYVSEYEGNALFSSRGMQMEYIKCRTITC